MVVVDSMAVLHLFERLDGVVEHHCVILLLLVDSSGSVSRDERKTGRTGWGPRVMVIWHERERERERGMLMLMLMLMLVLMRVM